MHSSNQAIAVRDLSKVYQIYSRPEDRLKQALLGRKRRYFQEFWALRGISFEIERGSTVGIVGHNGSGKSTLLQIICHTLRPSSGEVEVNGRVSALLELGSGFNPEFSGRENVYLNSAILGLSRDETDRLFDEIVAFADIGPHLDQPTKTYSTGMVMRLAFAVAISVNPDILVVDEALAVGDEAFQRRCMARIEAIKKKGATILFVSHSANQVVELCDRAILLDHGELLYDGPPRRAINFYHRLLYTPADRRTAFREGLLAARRGEALLPDEVTAAPAVAKDGAAPASEGQGLPSSPDDELEEHFNPGLVPQSATAYESRGAHIRNVRITNKEGRQVNVLVSGRRYALCYRVELEQGAWGVAVGTRLKTVTGVELGGSTTLSTPRVLDYVEAGTVLEVVHEFECRLMEGTYFLNASVSGLVEGERHWLSRLVDVTMFMVLPVRGRFSNGPIDFAFDSRAQPL
ncbi:ABC transporter ATP-binding protein [Azospirillum sp. SYSU D00513]|uniref:ABC transporter ATP-binding protein n=1 Tax=Azospirillum sp. SYSU D00513 TaxID=2812561 RepID=UPI001A95E29D|nr:ABC transporter ATP-binding protein [Azospirillum sp. SYSU D00513]